ncbi:MAG: glycerate kinase [bacterium]
MKVILAFDSFKGSISAQDACKAAAESIRLVDKDAEIISCPMSDGGEGFVDVLQASTKCAVVTKYITGPCRENIFASYLWIEEDKTAIIESATACGLPLVPVDKRNPSELSTFGVGQLIMDAKNRGAKKIIIGIGGTATVDGGVGMLVCAGWIFLNENGKEIEPVGSNLGEIAKIIPGERFAGIEIIIASDVTNSLTGEHGAAFVYGPQKGADPEMCEMLDKGMKKYAKVMASVINFDYNDSPGAGAAGGIGFALIAAFQGKFIPGADIVMQVSGFDDAICGADLVITGEGRTDAQTAKGKLPARVAQKAQQNGISCILLSGALGDGWRQVYDVGVTAVFSILDHPQSLYMAMNNAEEQLKTATENAVRLFIANKKIGPE